MKTKRNTMTSSRMIVLAASILITGFLGSASFAAPEKKEEKKDDEKKAGTTAAGGVAAAVGGWAWGGWKRSVSTNGAGV